MTSVKNVAIIPARGGSKGVPRKNVKLLAGKPLLAHTIEQALLAKTIDRVVVSTDDGEIEQVARRYGAQVVQRPADISGDQATSESALLHVLQFLDESENIQPELVTFLQCTSPLTLAADIDGTVQALRNQNADTAVAVTDFHYFIWQQNQAGNLSGINHEAAVRLRRQDREPQYLETGAVYVMRTAGFQQHRHRFFGQIAMYAMPPERCLEIDEPVDFEIAEMLLRKRHQFDLLSQLPDRISALVMDFDGVFTDNKVIVFQDGREAVSCNRSDGLGIARLKKTGLPLVVISTEKNPVVQARCQKLELECYQGIGDKLTVLREWLAKKQISIEETIYVGNDVNDRDCLQAVGCGVAVADAYTEVKAAAQLVLNTAGGQGALREIADLILKKM